METSTVKIGDSVSFIHERYGHVQGKIENMSVEVAPRYENATLSVFLKVGPHWMLSDCIQKETFKKV